MNDSRTAPTWQRCRWLIFDAVGTLIQPNPSVAVAYQTIASRHGSQLTVEEVGQRFRHAFRQSEQTSFSTTNGHHWDSNDQIELARWRWIVGEVVPDVRNHELCFDELWDHFARPTSWTCFDDVKPALAALGDAGYRLAIGSNFDSRLHRVCDAWPDLLPIERRFVSSETGYRKPAPQFYQALIAACDCAPDEILMIGDDPEHDVSGPTAAGIQARLIDRRTSSGTGTLKSLRELLAEIELQ